MLLKSNDNKKTLILVIACFFLVMLLNLIQLKYIYASEPNLTEIEKEYPNATSCINENASKYPYYIMCQLDDVNIKRRYIIFSDKQMLVTTNTEYFVDGGFTPDMVLFRPQKDFEISTYYYDFATNSWINGFNKKWDSNSETNYYVAWISSSNYLKFDNIDYVNYDLKTQNGTVVFQNARYQGTSVIGGITSKSIWTILLKTISGITVLVVGFLVSVTAFRKAWTMLKMVLVGA